MPNETQRNTRIEALEAKKASITAQLSRLNSEAAKEKRKLETRRKILIGAVILEEAARNPKCANWLRQQLLRGLTSPRDRATFNLPPLTGQDTVPNETPDRLHSH